MDKLLSILKLLGGFNFPSSMFWVYNQIEVMLNLRTNLFGNNGCVRLASLGPPRSASGAFEQL